jgi:hypothetical protein
MRAFRDRNRPAARAGILRLVPPNTALRWTARRPIVKKRLLESLARYMEVLDASARLLTRGWLRAGVVTQLPGAG